MLNSEKLKKLEGVGENVMLGNAKIEYVGHIRESEGQNVLKQLKELKKREDLKMRSYLEMMVKYDNSQQGFVYSDISQVNIELKRKADENIKEALSRLKEDLTAVNNEIASKINVGYDNEIALTVELKVENIGDKVEHIQYILEHQGFVHYINQGNTYATYDIGNEITVSITQNTIKYRLSRYVGSQHDVVFAYDQLVNYYKQLVIDTLGR